MARARTPDRSGPHLHRAGRPRACTCGAWWCSWPWSAYWPLSCPSSSWRPCSPTLASISSSASRCSLASFTRSRRCFASTPRSAGSTRFASPTPGSPSRTAPCSLRPWRPCCATARARSRCRPRPCARSWTRSARGSRRRATRDATWSGCWCSSGCSAPSGPARYHRLGRPRTISAIDTRASDSVTVFDELKNGLGGAAARHGHRVLVLALGPRRLAGARLPRAAGQPRARPLLQPARGMAVGHH